MGTIQERKRTDGSTAYQGQIVVKRDGLVHREKATFQRRSAAHAWIEKREAELRKPGALAALKIEDPPLRDAIGRYIAEYDRAMGRTKAQVLRTIQASALAETACSLIGSAEIVAYAQELCRSRQPQTVGNYLSHLSSVFSIAQPAWTYPLRRPARRLREADVRLGPGQGPASRRPEGLPDRATGRAVRPAYPDPANEAGRCRATRKPPCAGSGRPCGACLEDQ